MATSLTHSIGMRKALALAKNRTRPQVEGQTLDSRQNQRVILALQQCGLSDDDAARCVDAARRFPSRQSLDSLFSLARKESELIPEKKAYAASLTAPLHIEIESAYGLPRSAWKLDAERKARIETARRHLLWSDVAVQVATKEPGVFFVKSSGENSLVFSSKPADAI